jgi:hypothetical protein
VLPYILETKKRRHDSQFNLYEFPVSCLPLFLIQTCNKSALLETALENPLHPKFPKETQRGRFTTHVKEHLVEGEYLFPALGVGFWNAWFMVTQLVGFSSLGLDHFVFSGVVAKFNNEINMLGND